MIPFSPEPPTLSDLRQAARGCTACDLYRCGTQTVFGTGPERARAIFVGEQPGHEEDLAGQPFVGPAGRILDAALAGAGIDRAKIYVTNAVKHFKWKARGQRRIHVKPNLTQIMACRPWLEAELALLEPDVVVCLGATAAMALLGRRFRLSEQRGQLLSCSWVRYAMATVHPASILGVPESPARRDAMARFVADLSQVAPLLAKPDAAA